MKNSKSVFKESTGGITAPSGFKASGISAGIKKNNSPDMALVFSSSKCSAAGVFTKNRVKGHSLEFCSNNIKDGSASCIFINSGNANACVGVSGYEDARNIAKACSIGLGINPSDVLTASTGVIGYPLPMKTVLSGIDKAVSCLSENGGHDAALAIMTTDTFSKEFSIELEIDKKKVSIGGMAKGSGMIHPDMATMIAVLTTDALIDSHLLSKMLGKAAAGSFNKISVDGDTSVCDCVLILANGVSGCSISDDNDSYDIFFEALLSVCRNLSKQIVRDGEGATKLIEINVINAIDFESASLAAKAIATSPLVKTAFYGQDANWGRILTAAGYSGAVFDPNLTTISFGELIVFSKGSVVAFDEDKALEILSKDEITVFVDFGEGTHKDTVWTCDMSHGYIDINSHYRS